VPERLPATIAFALLLHLTLILGVRFVPESSAAVVAAALETTEVREQDVQAPDRARYLAQSASIGAGNTSVQERPRAPMAPAAPIELPGLDAGDEWLTATPGTASTEAPDTLVAPDPHQRLLHRAVTTARSPRELSTAARPVAGVDAPRVIISHLMTVAADSADPVSDVNQRAVASSDRVRERFVAVDARESQYAPYLEQWRRRVERIGNAEYPSEARTRGLSGKLVLEIVLNADGTIRQLATRRSSKHSVLDEAAWRAVRHAAPFAPFPPQLKAEADVLRFLYEWRYESGVVSATMRGARAG
jgi:protein TonB